MSHGEIRRIRVAAGKLDEIRTCINNTNWPGFTVGREYVVSRLDAVSGITRGDDGLMRTVPLDIFKRVSEEGEKKMGEKGQETKTQVKGIRIEWMDGKIREYSYRDFRVDDGFIFITGERDEQRVRIPVSSIRTIETGLEIITYPVPPVFQAAFKAYEAYKNMGG